METLAGSMRCWYVDFVGEGSPHLQHLLILVQSSPSHPQELTGNSVAKRTIAVIFMSLCGSGCGSWIRTLSCLVLRLHVYLFSPEAHLDIQ